MKKLYGFSSFLAFITGIILLSGGIWALIFTEANVVRERIITPSDASIPNTEVRGPLTLKAQADIIRHHTLESTDGKTYSEMPRQVQKLDENGNPVVDNQGNPVLVPNTARDIWITATSLTTALNLGIITYVFSVLVILLGLISIWNGFIFLVLARKTQ